MLEKQGERNNAMNLLQGWQGGWGIEKWLGCNCHQGCDFLMCYSVPAQSLLLHVHSEPNRVSGRTGSSSEHDVLDRGAWRAWCFLVSSWSFTNSLTSPYQVSPYWWKFKVLHHFISFLFKRSLLVGTNSWARISWAVLKILLLASKDLNKMCFHNDD
jgi:hypothetical protein